MLHGGLPRAYAAPGMAYLGGYLEELHHHHPHPYAYVPQQLEDSYNRLSEQRVLAWETSAIADPPRRASTPCPLDLSLKAAPNPTADECEAIEVDDEEDRQSREEARCQSYTREEHVVVDDEDSRRSCSSARGYQAKRIEPIVAVLTHQEAETLRLAQFSAYPNVHEHQKLLLASPASQQQHLQTTYQQLLQTPQHHHFQGVHAPITPPSTPSPPQCPRRKNREEDAASSSSGSSHTPKAASSGSEKAPRAKKKHARKLKFDEDTSSPVSGTVILGPDEALVTGDIDPAFNIVEVTEEARAELAKIENRLGPYQCKLCRQLHEDAFQLAQHRCSRIAHVEYRCPECDKRFSCPANLASHRRWHKPRPTPASGGNVEAELACARCEAKFNRQAALRKHMASQHPNEQNNNSNSNNNNENHNQGEAIERIAGPMEMA